MEGFNFARFNLDQGQGIYFEIDDHLVSQSKVAASNNGQYASSNCHLISGL